MSDIQLTSNGQGGDFVRTPENNDFQTVGSLHNQVYLACFGGNKDGSDWWGNKFFKQDKYKLNSLTEKALLEITLPDEVTRVEDAIKKDLSYLNEISGIIGVDVELFIRKLRWLDITITIQFQSIDDVVIYFNWDNLNNTLNN